MSGLSGITSPHPSKLPRQFTAMISERMAPLLPQAWVRATRRRIELAGLGGRITIDTVLSVKLVVAAVALLIALPIMVSRASASSVAVAALVIAVVFFVPDAILAGRARERQDLLLLSLPDTLDQITIAVEAGLRFDSALARVAQTNDGPLAHELARTLQEMQIGISRGQALRNLGDRTDVDDLRQFALAIVQAETYGIPIAQVLRVQAKELRVKRRQRAEEHALKIPVKIVFPLVLCILPSLFIVMLGPAAIRIFRDLLSPAL